MVDNNNSPKARKKKAAQAKIREELIGKEINNKLMPQSMVIEDTPEFRAAAKVYKLDVFESGQ